jgi:signal transduction histidine kinase
MNPAIGSGVNYQTLSARMGSGATQHFGTNFAQKMVDYLLKELVEGVVAVRTRELISNLLDVNTLEQFMARKERCDVRALIEKCLEHHQAAAAKKQIVFLTGVSAGLWARADRNALMQVVDNLISNAVKYSPPNTTVQIHALLENDCIIINVRDQGFGINEAGREKLFQKFSDLMACPGGEKMSNGVGMAIVKKVAAALSGSIRWRSSVGTGSTYTIKLPVARESNELPELSDIKLLARNIMPNSTPGFGFRN